MTRSLAVFLVLAQLVAGCATAKPRYHLPGLPLARDRPPVP